MARQDIEAGEQAWLSSFNGGDASGVAALYAESARLMPPNAEILDGRAAIEPFIKGFVQTGAKLTFELIHVHESPSMCVAVGRYLLDIPGAPQDRGKYIEVWASQGDGSWRIVDDMFNSSLPGPS
jgi:ketosteroid isomerase-like protein